MAYGTLTLADLQATLNASTVYAIGMDAVWEAIGNTLAAHNRIMKEIYAGFVVPTTEEADRYGGPDTMTMEDGDETSVPRAQKVTAGSTVGYPLNLVHAALQWTEMWYKKHTLGELAGQMDAMMDADTNRVIRDMKRALFLSSNYTFTDHLNRGIDLPVKRLVNADSQALPVGPNGETFTASTHTHYLFTATLTTTGLDAAINTIKEHYSAGNIQVIINQADETAMRALTGFVAYLDPRLIQANSVIQAGNRTLDVVQLYNRAIGLYNGAEVWVKPWGIASYPFVWNASAAKPLKWRYDPDYGNDLHLIMSNDGYPYSCRAYRRIFGIAAFNRINGCVYYTASGSAYADPTIN